MLLFMKICDESRSDKPLRPRGSGRRLAIGREKLADGNTPTRIIALKLGRTPASIYGEASKEDISLAPTNQRPSSA